ncbi:MAG TPA: GNAT family N-acetyltransferase [Candidatus Binataceae bacterium]|nr:GNAT family N-acetyltransferase [Candidatus Binataceae bacterium]
MGSESIEVRIESAEEIDPVLRGELKRWTDEVFGRIAYEWAPAQWYATARVEGVLAGSLKVVSREITAAEERVRVAGIGNVVTKPEYGKRGVATAMLRAAQDLMRTTLGAEFGLLICRHQVAPVYEKAGWIHVDGPTRFSQPSGIVTYPLDTMVVKLTAREWPGAPIDLCGPPW